MVLINSQNGTVQKSSELISGQENHFVGVGTNRIRDPSGGDRWQRRGATVTIAAVKW